MTTIEKTTRYATIVDTLPEAWTFVMAHVDNVGPRPSITVSPISSSTFGEEWVDQFEVAVSGMVEDPETGDER